MIQIRNFINGQWQEETGGKTVPLYNPSTGETIGSVPISNMETCEAAIATAAEAYKTWRLVPIAKRMTYIHKIRECMIRDLEKLAQGKDGIDFFTQNKVTTIRTVDPNAKKGGEVAKPKSVRSCVAS